MTDIKENDKTVQSVLCAPHKLTFGKQLTQEISLPDFYEDVTRVIDCSVTAHVKEKSLSDGELFAMGEASYTVLYYSDKDSVLHRFFFEQEFEAKWELDDDGELLDVLLFTREPSVKIYGARRLLVSMDCDFVSYICKKQSLLPIETKGAELLQKQGESFSFESVEAEKSRFSEDVLLPSQLPPVEELIYWTLTYESARSDARADGIIVSAQAELSFIYVDKDGEYVSYKSLLPLTKLVRAGHGDVINAELCVNSLKCAPVTDQSGENRVIAVDFELGARVSVFKNVPFSYVLDAYFTEFSTELVKSELSFSKICGVCESLVSVNERVENDGDISKLLCARAVPTLSKTRRDGQMLYMEGSLSLTLLAKTQSGGISAYEHSVSFDTSLKLPEDSEITPVSLHVEKLGLDGQSGEPCLDITVKASALAFSSVKTQHVEQMIKGELSSEDGDYSMLVYYPDKDESLWQIGKSHRVSTEKIAQINKLEANTLEGKKFILIPTK